jgi:osmotically-inducible protein OsmY
MRLQNKLNVTILLFVFVFIILSCGLPTRTPQQIAQDEEITKKVLAKLQEVPLRPRHQDYQDYLKATTQLGVVHLVGVVEDQFIKNKAIALAKSVDGVRDVTDLIRIEPERGGGGGFDVRIQ